MTNINAEIAAALFEEDTDAELSKSIASLPTEDDPPCSDGVPMDTQRHGDQMVLLIESLKAYRGEERRYYVGGNMFLHYEISGSGKYRGPDVFLVMDVENRERKSWVVWQEGMRFPDLIIGLLSDSTRKTDKTVKIDGVTANCESPRRISANTSPLFTKTFLQVPDHKFFRARVRPFPPCLRVSV